MNITVLERVFLIFLKCPHRSEIKAFGKKPAAIIVAAKVFQWYILVQINAGISAGQLRSPQFNYFLKFIREVSVKSTIKNGTC